MQISAIQSYAFTSNSFAKISKMITEEELFEGQILKDGQIFNRHTTNYFREDMDWSAYADVLQKKFANVPKIDTLIWGCSNGNEAYTMSILLKYCFGGDYKKFLPIKAMDIDKDLIEQNKKEQKENFEFSNSNLINLCYALGISYSDNMDVLWDFVLRTGFWKYNLQDDILNSVEFSQSNILSDVDKIDPNVPTIVMCRNMWPYVDSDKYNEYAKKLHDRLNENSIVVVGRYDWEGENHNFDYSSFPKVLMRNGFKPIGDIINPDRLYDALPRGATLLFEPVK